MQAGRLILQKPMHKILASIAVTLGLATATTLAGAAFVRALNGDAQAQDWRTASRAPMGWAPAPETYEPAIVQAYAARAVRWRGSLAVHCWIAVKPAGATQYRRYEVTGFDLRRTGSSIRITDTATPDTRWFGAEATLLRDIRGADAEAIIAAIPAAVESYPYAEAYRAWPGPNSNTFIAHIAREIPEMRLSLPGHAIGKDYTGWSIVTSAPSGTGFQISLGGVLGVMLAGHEGLEVNLLGFVFGADPLDLSLKLPALGDLPSRTDWTGGQHAPDT